MKIQFTKLLSLSAVAFLSKATAMATLEDIARMKPGDIVYVDSVGTLPDGVYDLAKPEGENGPTVILKVANVIKQWVDEFEEDAHDYFYGDDEDDEDEYDEYESDDEGDEEDKKFTKSNATDAATAAHQRREEPPAPVLPSEVVQTVTGPNDFEAHISVNVGFQGGGASTTTVTEIAPSVLTLEPLMMTSFQTITSMVTVTSEGIPETFTSLLTVIDPQEPVTLMSTVSETVFSTETTAITATTTEIPAPLVDTVTATETPQVVTATTTIVPEDAVQTTTVDQIVNQTVTVPASPLDASTGVTFLETQTSTVIVSKTRTAAWTTLTISDWPFFRYLSSTPTSVWTTLTITDWPFFETPSPTPSNSSLPSSSSTSTSTSNFTIPSPSSTPTPTPTQVTATATLTATEYDTITVDGNSPSPTPKEDPCDGDKKRCLTSSSSSSEQQNAEDEEEEGEPSTSSSSSSAPTNTKKKKKKKTKNTKRKTQTQTRTQERKRSDNEARGLPGRFWGGGAFRSGRKGGHVEWAGASRPGEGSGYVVPSPAAYQLPVKEALCRGATRVLRPEDWPGAVRALKESCRLNPLMPSRTTGFYVRVAAHGSAGMYACKTGYLLDDNHCRADEVEEAFWRMDHDVCARPDQRNASAWVWLGDWNKGYGRTSADGMGAPCYHPVPS